MAISETEAAPRSRHLVRDDDGTVRLIGGYSPTSGQHHFPLSDCCPYSGAVDIETVVLPSAGELLYWTVVTAPPPGYFGPTPYGLGVVRLDGLALELVTRLDITSADEVVEGQRLTLEAETLPGGPGEAGIEMWRFVRTRAMA